MKLQRIVKVLVLPGGRLPEQGRPREDAGYDVSIRAIVGTEICPQTHARESLWDFTCEPHSSISRNITEIDGKPAYTLRPGELVRVGYGVIFGMTNDWFAYTAPRSKSASRAISVYDHFHRVPIDPGFRGEVCGELRLDSSATDPVYICHGDRLAQLIFLREIPEVSKRIQRSFFRPQFLQVQTLDELGKSQRGICWNGSSESRQSPNGHFQLELWPQAKTPSS